MKLELSHIAIACPAIQQLADKLKALALEIEVTHDVPSEKVKAAMLPVNVSEHFRLELLEPTDPNSPISKFLSKRPDGGIHHVSFEVSQIEKWQEVLIKSGFEILPPGIRKGARGKALLYIRRALVEF
ncbi:methylmalonyl-CoA epimerase [bacterium]|nr:methylmalonyl-CoA epimerase [bacterium]